MSNEVTHATPYEQARMIIELSNWADSYGAYEAIEWVHSTKFDAVLERLDQVKTSHQEYRYFSRVAGFHETTSVFWKHGAISSAMLFDWLDFVPLWKRVEPMIMWDRQRSNNPQLWRGFESIAKEQVALKSQTISAGSK